MYQIAGTLAQTLSRIWRPTKIPAGSKFHIYWILLPPKCFSTHASAFLLSQDLVSLRTPERSGGGSQAQSMIAVHTHPSSTIFQFQPSSNAIPFLQLPTNEVPSFSRFLSVCQIFFSLSQLSLIPIPPRYLATLDFNVTCMVIGKACDIKTSSWAAVSESSRYPILYTSSATLPRAERGSSISEYFGRVGQGLRPSSSSEELDDNPHLYISTDGRIGM